MIEIHKNYLYYIFASFSLKMTLELSSIQHESWSRTFKSWWIHKNPTKFVQFYYKFSKFNCSKVSRYFSFPFFYMHLHSLPFEFKHIVRAIVSSLFIFSITIVHYSMHKVSLVKSSETSWNLSISLSLSHSSYLKAKVCLLFSLFNF